MKLVRFIAVIAAICACGEHQASAGSAGQTAQPNIVLIVTDDQGADSLGCYGNPVIKTPRIDQLAAEGVRFDNCYASASSCSSNRSVLLSGLQHYTNGMYGLAHPPHGFHSHSTVKSLPWFLAKDGYRTGHVGKYHLAPEDVYPFECKISASSHNAVEMAEKSRDFIVADSKRPFFLFFCTSAPHVGGGKFDQLPYKPDRFHNRPEGYLGVEPVKYDPEQVVVPPYLPDIPETRAELAQYYQAVSRADQGVGHLLDILKETGTLDKTVIVFLSDNGHAMPLAKATLYDAGIRLPCIVRTPWQRNRGIVNHALIGFTDITPTLLDFAKALPKKDRFHGRSFRGILEEENPNEWDEVYAGHTFHEISWFYPIRMVRSGKYKLLHNLAFPLENPAVRRRLSVWKAVENRNLTHCGKRAIADCLRNPEFELYDLQSDPHEVVNLADDPAHAELLESLKRKLRDYRTRTRDPWLDFHP